MHPFAAALFMFTEPRNRGILKRQQPRKKRGRESDKSEFPDEIQYEEKNENSCAFNGSGYDMYMYACQCFYMKSFLHPEFREIFAGMQKMGMQVTVNSIRRNAW